MAVTAPTENLPIEDMSASLPTETMLPDSSEQGKIGGGNVVQIFENTHKYIGQVRSGEEQTRLTEESTQLNRDLYRTPLAQRRQALKDAGRIVELNKLVQAIDNPVLRDDFPALASEFKKADEYVFKIQGINESLKGLEIKPEIEAIVEAWDSYLYDQSGNPVDQARQLSNIKAELGKAVGGSAKSIKEEQLRLLKEGAQTPEILKLYFQTETVLESQLGETFASYLKLKEVARKAGERGGKPLTTKETKDWNEIKGVVETQFAGKENLLAILTGDFEKDDVLSKSEKRVLGAARNMVSMMAKADGKGLGRARGERVEEGAMPQVVESTSELLRPQEENLEPGVQNVLNSYIARMAKENRTDWNPGERDRVIERAKLLLAGNKQ